MKFTVGTKIIWQGNDNNTLRPLVKSGTITKIGRDTVWIDNQHKPEDQLYASFLYPDTEECRAFLQAGIELSLRHKAEQDARFVQVLEFNNELVRKGLK